MKFPIDHLSPKKRQWISLAVLFMVNLLNYMDRYTLSSVLPDFSAEMCPGGCSFSQQGLLQTALVIVYLLSAPLFGYLGDRYSRKLLITIGIILWASFSLASSFMPSYWYYLVVRALLSVGESGFTVIAPTIIGDLFTEEKRSLAYGLFYIAIPFGTGLGFFVGGMPSDWRWGLRITPIISFSFLIIVILFLYDPPRGESEGKDSSNQYTFWSDLKYIAGVKSFILNAAGFTCVTFLTGCLAYYGPTYYEKGINSTKLPECSNVTNWEGPDYQSPITLDGITFVFGVVVCIGGLLGVIGGMVTSVFLRQRFQWIDPVICGVSLLICIPIQIGGIFIAKEHIVASFIVICLGNIFMNFNWSVAVDMTIYVITPARRSSAEAIHLMLTHALGEAGSPFLVGFLIDAMEKKVAKSHDGYCSDMVTYLAIQQSLFLPFAVVLLGGLLFLVATKWIVNDKLAVEQEEGTINST